MSVVENVFNTIAKVIITYFKIVGIIIVSFLLFFLVLYIRSSPVQKKCPAPIPCPMPMSSPDRNTLYDTTLLSNTTPLSNTAPLSDVTPSSPVVTPSSPVVTPVVTPVVDITPSTITNALNNTTSSTIVTPPVVGSSNLNETYVYNPFQIKRLLDEDVRNNLSFRDYKRIMKVGDVSEYFKIREILKSCNSENDCISKLEALY